MVDHPSSSCVTHTYVVDIVPHTDRGAVVTETFSADSDRDAESYAKAAAWEYAGVTLWKVYSDGRTTRLCSYGRTSEEA